MSFYTPHTKSHRGEFQIQQDLPCEMDHASLAYVIYDVQAIVWKSALAPGRCRRGRSGSTTKMAQTMLAGFTNLTVRSNIQKRIGLHGCFGARDIRDWALNLPLSEASHQRRIPSHRFIPHSCVKARSMGKLGPTSIDFETSC